MVLGVLPSPTQARPARPSLLPELLREVERQYTQPLIFATFPPTWSLPGEVSEYLPTQPRTPCRGAQASLTPPLPGAPLGVPIDREDRFPSSF